ncbi:PREDICTED: abhydrolase domain-containing protein 16A-like [Priapulus caudatus]|uniref:Abhydrolase domain-containing protein 16A-like n=1 Tax=Priapulus caudatus TaxID=37621 RepID=A0ABM1DY07_PRICU|nr:PREDICTED: abhydrolase domain-containing protein 16A-like [Priapulus caudatus]
MAYYTAPVLVPILYRRAFFSIDGLTWSIQMGGTVAIFLTVAVICRAIGRVTNSEYQKFIKSLCDAKAGGSAEHKKLLSGYDFEFVHSPIQFSWNHLEKDDQKQGMDISAPETPKNGFIGQITGPLSKVLGYFAIHSFGRRLIYPGTLSFMQSAMAPALEQGRAKLVEEHGGQRAKLQCRLGNEIDTMFVDKRGNESGSINRDTLVVTCEGNAGFYEIGCMATPLDCGYSVLGWNHPGFWGSTGVPLPDQEASAIDIVMKYATKGLNFQPENIIIFAWSIGGYTATWAAMNYPDVKAVILDATFDDLEPLAIARMPDSWRSLVTAAVRTHMNMNIAEQLIKYPGVIKLIRRTNDEMITTVEPPQPTSLRSNRGNNLLIKLLQYRYPNIVKGKCIEVLWRWLECGRAQQILMWSQYNIDKDICSSIISSAQEHSTSYPVELGEEMGEHQRIILSLYLADKYMAQYDSTHCTPLPANFLQLPLTDQVETSYEIVDNID